VQACQNRQSRGGSCSNRAPGCALALCLYTAIIISSTNSGMPSAGSMISAITIRPIAPRGPVSRRRPSRADVSQRYFFPRDYFLFFLKVSTREAPHPIFRNPPVSARPHNSARAGVHKEPEPRQLVSDAVTVPVTPPCPNCFVCLFKKAAYSFLRCSSIIGSPASRLSDI
jgi:hypothetical protein